METKKIADKYTYRIEWSEKDREYAGLCAEFRTPTSSRIARVLAAEVFSPRPMATTTMGGSIR